MRLEGFVSLLACVMLLFLIGIGVGALQRELHDLSRPVTRAPSSSPG
ncbi:MAG: hypothetical protein K0Q76_3690 [Panacagrimonas sp.]|jgi:hypothetical protein|nr:hypothetical protein [Panacagrimonas sp.]MCC2658582.1 hypothetical protein [Panacagrimonas sp.]